MAYLTNLLNLLKNSYLKMVKHPMKTLMIIAIDFMTFLVFALVAGLFQDKMMDRLMAINNLVSSRLSGITDASVGKVSEALGMISIDAFMGHYNAFLILLALMFLCSTIVYIFFQHWNWIKSIRLINDEKIRWKPYLARFAAIAAVWLIVFVVSMIFYIKLSLQSVIFTGVSTYGEATRWFILIIFLLGFYFSFAGYSIAHKHGLPQLLWMHVVEGLKKTPYILPIFIIFLLKAYAIFELMGYLFPTSVHVMVPLTVILVMPFITWLRFSYILANKETKPEKRKRSKPATIVVKKIKKKSKAKKSRKTK